MLDDMPRSPGFKDSLADFVANTLDRAERLELEKASLQQELDDVECEVAEIQSAISELHPDYQQVLRMVFRDGHTYRSAALRLHRSKSRVQEMVERAVVEMERWR
ncbi:sigma factor-like helix-turn-helix DNA-binding protein [Alicyclobacillus herbarius]|uniref:sigma factor-like helix-turn-helix DNA-binding protein n=1 Tax=Alicyclobacillus herbarius TaxID=122960 RepID=UPI0004058F8C|nr:sigma factor-like helix-turn-helix DNA-binding protein [Alicyclobacillus herbarius]